MTAKIKHFIQKETVLCIAALCALATVAVVPPDMEYLHYIDFRVLCLLFCLMAVVAGFQALGLFGWLTDQLLRRVRNGHLLSVALVLLPFLSAMVVTNDVALLIFVPFTLDLLSRLGREKAGIPMIVLQTVGANLGSMATPVGNPQNLYLYSAYNLAAGEFFAVTLPLTAVSLVVLCVAAWPVLPKELPRQRQEEGASLEKGRLLIFVALFALCLLTVFRVVPYPITTVVIAAALLVLDKKLLGKVDYMLLLTFVCFFIFVGNMGELEAVRTLVSSILEGRELLVSALISQLISNVPAALMLSGFTDKGTALLIGTNIGGLGTLWASLASLITFKLYSRSENAKSGAFFGSFTLWNVAFLAVLLVVSLILN